MKKNETFQLVIGGWWSEKTNFQRYKVGQYLKESIIFVEILNRNPRSFYCDDPSFFVLNELTQFCLCENETLSHGSCSNRVSEVICPRKKSNSDGFTSHKCFSAEISGKVKNLK